MELLKPLFERVPEPAVPTGLLERVLLAIQQAQIRRIQQRIILAFAGIVASVGYALYYGNLLWNEWRASSFINLLRLAISDPDIVFGSSQEFMLGLIESLPAATIFFVLLAGFLLMGVSVLVIHLLQIRRAALTQHRSLAH
jgi:hypothetical protein